MAVAAKGTILQIGDGAATEVFTSIAELRDVSGGGDTLDVEDVTHHGSAREEIVPTIVRNSELSFQINYDPGSATHGTGGLRGDLEGRTSRNFKLYVPGATGGTTYDVSSFAAYVTGIQPSYAVTGAVLADCTLRINGAQTWTTSATGP